MSRLKSYLWHRDFITATVIALLSLTILFYNPAPLRYADGVILDWLFKLRGPVEPLKQPIALVMVDDASIAEAGRWPWPRARIAELFDKLAGQYHAHTLVSDVVFPEAERNTLSESADWLGRNGKAIPAELGQYAALADGDRMLAGAFGHSPSLVLGFYYYAVLPDALKHLSREAMLERIDKAILETVHDEAGKSGGIIEAKGVNASIPMLSARAQGAGFLNFAPDQDGSLRYVPLLMRFHGFYLPSLALAAVSCFETGSAPSASMTREGARISFGDHHIETTAQGTVWVNYYGPGESVPTYSARDVLDGSLPPGALRDKLVFVGVSAAGTGDVRATPLDAMMPGTEVQAQIALNLINDDQLRRPTAVHLFELGMVLLIWLGYGLFFRHVIERFHGLASIAMVPVYLVFAYGIFLQNIWLHSALSLVQLMLTFMLLFSMHYTEELLNRRHLRHAFASFVDPAVVNEVAERKDEIGLSGEEREISVMFIDLAGFTSLSERLAPHEVVHHINAFFDAATAIIFENKGCIDRLTGDGLVALFGAPMRDPEHAENACRAALQMEAALDPLRPSFERLNHPLRVRSGVNSGMMVIGNMGSTRRMQYTFMGDSGNAAARLESLNKQYGSLKMIGEPTRQRIADAFVCRELDSVQLVGKQDALRVFELLGEAGQQAGWQPLLDAYGAALELYRQGDFAAAASAFSASATQFNDAVSRRMQQRCEALATQPPADWRGIWVATAK